MKKYLRKSLAVLLVLSMVLAWSVMGFAATPGGKKELVVYFANWDFYSANPEAQVKNLPWDRLTYINHAFWKIQKTDDGKFPIVSTDVEADITNEVNHFDQYAEYSAKYPDVNVVLSVGGWTCCEYFSEMAATAEGRKSFIDSCIETMDTYTWVDGIDIDWEYPGEERDGCPASENDDVNYVLLLKEMREAFDAKYGAGVKKLTVCSSTNIASLSHQDLPGIAQYVDLINIMTYDMAASWDPATGHQSALYSPNEAAHSADKAVNYFLSQGVAPSKLNIGSPLYCKGWGGVKPDENGNLVGVPGSADGYQGDMTWNVLKSVELLAVEDGELGWHKGYDETAQAPYLYNDNPNSKYYGNFLTYEDEQSVQAKADYINEKGLAGLIVWEIGNDAVVDGCPMISTMAKSLGLYNGEIPAYTPVEIDDTVSDSGLPNPMKETVVGDGSISFGVGTFIYYKDAVYKAVLATNDWPDNMPDGKWGSCWEKQFDVKQYVSQEDNGGNWAWAADEGDYVFYDPDKDGKGAIYLATAQTSNTANDAPDGIWGTNWKYITDLWVGAAADPNALPDPMVETVVGDGSIPYAVGDIIYYKNAIWKAALPTNDWVDNLPDGKWGDGCWTKVFDVKTYVSQEELGYWDWAADEGEYVIYNPTKGCESKIYLATAQTSNTANDAPDGIWGTNWQYVTTIISHVTEIQNAKEATCTEDGYTGDEVCTACGETVKAGEVIPALGHKIEIKDAEEPTYLYTGYTGDKVCSVCGELIEKGEEIPVLPFPFVDVTEKDYFFLPTLWALECGITSGTDATHFSPKGITTRAEMVTFLWAMADRPEPETTKNPFVDVKESAWYYKAVLWAYENGITAGVDATHFAPGKTLTRAQAVTFLYAADGKPVVEDQTNPFSDVNPKAWYGQAVLWAAQQEITAGIGGGRFGINQNCSRAETVTFLFCYVLSYLDEEV